MPCLGHSVSERGQPSTARDLSDRHTSEAEFQRTLMDACNVLGLPVMHIRDSRGQPAEGVPDLLIADHVHGVVYSWELKTMTGKASVRQQWWLNCMSRCSSFSSGLYRPSDLDQLLALLRDGPR